MPQEAKSALAFTLFYTYGMGPEGGPSVAVKQMWIFKISGEVSNEAFCRHGVTLKNKKIWPTIDDNCINMTRKEQLFRRCRISSGRQQVWFSKMAAVSSIFGATWCPAMAAGVVLQESNTACNCSEANGKKIK